MDKPKTCSKRGNAESPRRLKSNSGKLVEEYIVFALTELNEEHVYTLEEEEDRRGFAAVPIS